MHSLCSQVSQGGHVAGGGGGVGGGMYGTCPALVVELASTRLAAALRSINDVGCDVSRVAAVFQLVWDIGCDDGVPVGIIVEFIVCSTVGVAVTLGIPAGR